MITYPLNNIDYTAEDAELFHCTRTSGIWAENSFQISATGSDNNVTIGTGIAWIKNEEFSGKVTALKTAKVLDLGIADGAYPRIDVIAIQFNANSNETDVVVKRGTPATNPIKPAIVRTGAVYELYLASVYRPAGATIVTTSNITDLRMDETVCGLMADSVTKVDMKAIEAQVRSLINNLQNEIDSVRNLSGIMFESEWVDGDVISVLKGGTGANNAEEALNNLGGMSKTLLWENASPGSDFAAQSITVDTTPYDFIEIESVGASPSATIRQGEGVSNQLTYIWAMPTNSFVAEREFQIYNQSVKFGEGHQQSFRPQVTDPFTLNSRCKPYRIYGIKGVK